MSRRDAIFEIVVSPNAPIAQSPLKDVILPVGSLIGGVKKKRSCLYSSWLNDRIHSGDHIVVMTTPRAKKHTTIARLVN